MMNFKGWISNTYPHYLKEDNDSFSSKPQIVRATPQDAENLIFPLNDILYKIINVTPFDLLKTNRDDPEKFEKDAANMKSTSLDKQTRMTMSQGNMNKPTTIFIVEDEAIDDAMRRTERIGTIHAYTKQIGNTSAIVMRRSSFSTLPSSQYPVGLLTDHGQQILAHEAGHAAQVGNRIPDTNAQQYQKRDQEIGTRLAKLKNINTKQTLFNLVKKANLEEVKYALYAVKVLPDNEIERFKALLIKPQWLNYLKSAQKSPVTDEQFVRYYINPVIQALSEHDSDIGDLFKTVERSNGVDGIVQKLIYAYDRVAKGNTEPQGNQERQMA
jgi:hypothetical protein